MKEGPFFSDTAVLGERPQNLASGFPENIGERTLEWQSQTFAPV